MVVLVSEQLHQVAFFKSQEQEHETQLLVVQSATLFEQSVMLFAKPELSLVFIIQVVWTGALITSLQ
jgi:hypothetical protein